jgi:hypothetical protein
VIARCLDVQYCCADGASLFELLMCVDQLIKAIDVRWVDLEDSRLYGVEEIGGGGSESFRSVVVVRQNCPRQIKRSGCQLKWTDWFRETRCFAELNQRAAGLSTASEPRNVSLPTES